MEVNKLFYFTFRKPYYSQEELLDLFNLSKSTLQRYREEALKNNGELFETLGYFKIEGIKEAQYEPVRFSTWLLENKINIPTNYSHDKAEKEKLRKGLMVLSNLENTT